MIRPESSFTSRWRPCFLCFGNRFRATWRLPPGQRSQFHVSWVVFAAALFLGQTHSHSSLFGGFRSGGLRFVTRMSLGSDHAVYFLTVCFCCLFTGNKKVLCCNSSSYIAILPLPHLRWHDVFVFFLPELDPLGMKRHTHTSLSHCIWDNVFCTRSHCGLFVKILFCLFVFLCQHCTFSLLLLPGPFKLFKPASSGGVTQHGETGEDDQRNWFVVISSHCFEREQQKKWGLEKYLEEYFSCGKNVWRPERSCGICMSDANNIEILYLGNTHRGRFVLSAIACCFFWPPYMNAEGI